MKENAMYHQFDELTKGLAQSVTRRGALKKFGVGLAGMALACFGLEAKAQNKNCKPNGSVCTNHNQCCSGWCFAFTTGNRVKSGYCR